MNARRLHYFLVRLKRVKYSYLLAALLFSGLVFVLAYRQNNLTALHLREKLLEVDKSNGDTEAALRDLREYTYSHMNAELTGGANNIYPPIQLKFRYERLVQAEKARVAQANSKLYNEAQAYCERLMPTGVSRNRVPCIEDYVTRHNGQVEQPIPDSLYKFNFVSPAWSPDLAGWSLVITVLLAVTLCSRWLLELWLKHRIRT
jgi:hypothetical protein